MKKLLKKWWFWVIIVIIFASIIGGNSEEKSASVKPEEKFTVTAKEIPKTEEQIYGEWVEGQFSISGKNYELVSIVKSSMNDEKSFEHIGTTYTKILTEEKINQVNSIIEEYDVEKVSKYDTYLCMEFSGKNAFGGVVKQKAYAIMYYDPEGVGTTSLLDIE